MKRNRISRGLVASCVVTLLVGVAAYALHHRLSHAETVASADQTKIEKDVAAKPPAPVASVVVSATPSTMPVTAQGGAVATHTKLSSADLTHGAPVMTAAWTPTATPVPDAPTGNFIAAAAAKSQTGDLLGARKMLNDALLSGKLSAFDTEATKKSITDLNAQLIFSPHKYSDDTYGGVYPVKPGESLQKIAAGFDVPWQFLASINNLTDPRKMKSGSKLKIIRGPFAVVVSKNKFNMDLWLGGTPGEAGSMFVRSYPVGLGRDDSTPTGTWMVGTKAKDPIYYSPRGEGVMQADDPKNPLGHRWISLNGVEGKALGAQSYGIHGTIEPDSIGKQSSMGCIRMHNEDVAVVFDLVAEGKSIVLVQ